MQHALARCDAGLLPISARLSAGRRSELAALTGAEWAWSPARRHPLTRLAPGGSNRSPALWADDPLALVIETSGSSGSPKAAMLSQGAVLASCSEVNTRLGLGPRDLWLCCLPRHHIGGLVIAYRCALAGAALLVHRAFDAATVADDLAKWAVTHVSLVPPMLAGLLAVGTPPPPSLRVALIGGQALSATLTRQALDAGWPLLLTYGMTETCSQIATSEPLTRVPEAGVVGAPLPRLTLDCPACGEPPRSLRVRGPMVMAGYARPDRAPGLGLDQGWLTTADLACRTQEGDLRILGRADEALVIGGVQVYPAEVADRLTQAPGIQAAVVVGIPDAVWGHRLIGVYVGTLAGPELTAWCRAHLPRRQRPAAVVRLDALPLLPSGKYDLARIRELATGT